VADDLLAVLDRNSPFDAFAEEPALDAHAVSELAAIDGAEGRLVELAGDPAAPPARRYAAAEALLQGQLEDWRSSPDSVRAVADALAVSLREDTSHNRWGLPGHFAGRLGKQLVALPSGVDEALEPLLDDNAPLVIEGSEAATINEMAHYRIADLAAYLLSLHRGSVWDAPVKPSKRAKFIARLKG
jgi:hypothetical protein